MTGEELLKSMDLTDPALVEAAGSLPGRKGNGWIKWCSLAAAVLAVSLLLGRPEKGTVVSIGDIARTYKSVPMVQSETAPYYPWEYLTEAERYTYMLLEGMEYRTRLRTVDPKYLAERIGEGIFPATDIDSGQDHTAKKEVFAIQKIPPSELVAVELGEEFLVFANGTYSPPPDFGTFWDETDLSNTVELSRFSYFYGNNENNQQTNHFLEDDSALWEMLEKCRNAPFLERDPFYDTTVESVSFSVTSERLGIYKHGFRISADGYISTNLMEWGYVFQIGEDAARIIINHVKEHSVSVPFEPYYQFLYGTFVGTEEGFLLVDDTVLCVNPEEGMVFRVPMEDIRISRTVTLGHIEEGDIVLVNFTGKVDTAAGNTVLNPVSIQKGFLTENGVLVEE